MKKVLLMSFMVIFGYSVGALAVTLRIQGMAAQTLFICDYHGNFSCWYARPHSYCDLEISNSISFLSSGSIIVHGLLAAKIFLVTYKVTDGEKYSPYDYGGRGISCGKDGAGEYLCSLDVERAHFLSKP